MRSANSQIRFTKTFHKYMLSSRCILSISVKNFAKKYLKCIKNSIILVPLLTYFIWLSMSIYTENLSFQITEHTCIIYLWPSDFSAATMRLQNSFRPSCLFLQMKHCRSDLYHIWARHINHENYVQLTSPFYNLDFNIK